MSSPQTNPILQGALVDLIDLTLLAKQAHWNVHGSHFRSVHLELDEVEAQLRDAQDLVAERLAAVGGNPDGRASTVLATSSVDDIGAGPLAADKVVILFADRLNGVARRLEAELGELDADLPSQDILIGTIQELDKAAWMFRAQES
ncbi:MAG: DNA starvation/stationary phase protection protein [Bifidobacteriaceae bacterium]|jgi:starvation-inducible DNA-binding protein|nr:DNA starvation/stationary phase protection protein [Bifidobacteriaceae bacterium]